METLTWAAGLLQGRSSVMKDDDENLPKKKIVHEIGQELATLSVKELDERIALLKEEIARLKAAIARKQSSRNVADAFFKR